MNLLFCLISMPIFAYNYFHGHSVITAWDFLPLFIAPHTIRTRHWHNVGVLSSMLSQHYSNIESTIEKEEETQVVIL